MTLIQSKPRAHFEEDKSGVHLRPGESIDLAVWRRTYAPALLGEDPNLISALKLIQRVADTDCPVLVIGKTGTGKELVARAIHAASRRASSAFIAVNCAALPEHLVETELFGHVRGAFTGAVDAREGHFVAAHGGTLFLDEIGELPLSQQAKLLRALQACEVTPVGDSKPRKVDIRLVAATHRDLEAMVEAGTFREDLLYRIQVISTELSALCDRRGDIAELVRHFIARSNARRKRRVSGISAAALATLETYAWPGNVRQLENVVERLVVLRGEGEIDVADLPPRFFEGDGEQDLAATGPVLPDAGIDLRDAIEQFESGLIVQALERSGWNKKRAAAVLRMNRTTLVEKLKKMNLPDVPPDPSSIPPPRG